MPNLNMRGIFLDEFSPGWPQDEIQNLHTGDLGKTRQKRVMYVVDASLRTLEVCVVSVLSLVALVVLRPTPHRVAE